VKCVGSLLKISPLSVEPLIGNFCAIFLFNIDHVDVSEFWKEVLETFVKLRQVPKLIAKLIISVSKNHELKVSELSLPVTEPLSEVFEGLPVAQIMEVWKTLLFHMKQDIVCENPSANMKSLLNCLFATFFTHICILDHAKSKSALSKIVELIKSTQSEAFDLLEDTSGFLEARRAFAELIVALCHFRGLDEDLKEVQEKAEKVYAGLSVEDRSDNQLPTELSDEEVIGLALFDKCDEERLSKISDYLLDIKPDVARHALENSSTLQTVFVAKTILKLADILDVDTSCEEIFKPFVKQPKKLFKVQTDPESVIKMLKKSYAFLDSCLANEMVNEDFSPTFYFSKSIQALELLPLENLTPILSNLCFITILTLISICSHEEVNDQLIKIFARCLETSRDPDFMRYLDPSKVLLWTSKLRYYNDPAILSASQKLLSRIIVKGIKEFASIWPNFTQNIDRLPLALKSLNNERSVGSAVTFMEALEKPLVYQDAAPEKLDLCRKHFQKFAK
jgi:hypothetical protein